MRGCALPLTKLAFASITDHRSSFSFSVTLNQQWCSLSLHSPKASILFPSRQFNFKAKANAEFSPSASVVATEAEEEESFQVLSIIKSDYNDIVIVDTPKARMLLLDSSRISLYLCLVCSSKTSWVVFVCEVHGPFLCLGMLQFMSQKGGE